jgi:hypothetical protein
MIDVTEQVETKLMPRNNGKAVRDELWHEGRKIGFLESMGPVLDDRGYILRLVPNRRFALEQRIFQLEDGDMAT